MANKKLSSLEEIKTHVEGLITSEQMELKDFIWKILEKKAAEAKAEYDLINGVKKQ